MIRLDKTELKVGITMEVLWKALTKDFAPVALPNIPHLVKNVKTLEGDGGMGTVYLIEIIHPDVPNLSPQLEKVVDFDESLHQIALQVFEGGCMNLGYIFYKTTFQLTKIGDSETLVNIRVAYEIDSQKILAPGEAVKLAVLFIKSLETLPNKQG